ncbi:AmmeMemoRadiSam system protein B [Maribellus maritimus]|uniref:AmmeMemoRadiSam system protein B n=1 Tax=Maribellus maritimus TaxID=2870838 RepID=UPI001EEA2D3E|nr:AmmeMemoRadiSam system protein B [Maribellus maritimus]MCG6188274.1 AmmeMemoRadiSam system protein B [Maribellus maritimus]
MENRLQKYKNREAAVAGRFYPGTKQALRSELEHLFRAAQKRKETPYQLQALVSPHAGYIFSGEVAASAFNQIPENSSYKRIFIIASSHRYHFNGGAVYNAGNYETPLGEIDVDIKLANQLIRSSKVIVEKNEAHQLEHSLEVQLPLLQYKLNNKFMLVPIIIGTQDPDVCKHLANALKPYFNQENLFIFSTDFSHYPAYADANKIDFHTAQAICGNNPKELLNVLNKHKTQNIPNLATPLCSWPSVLTLLYLTESQNFLYEKIEYKNSGDAEIYGDKKKVVGYWAIACYKKNGELFITNEEKSELLEKARTAITHFIKSGEKAKTVPSGSGGILNEIAGAFVSIYINNELRGCIGGFARTKTLNEMVQSMAVSAACDIRFENLQEKELNNMQLEISVLTPLKKIKSIDEIELGKHGIYIKKGLNTGTFLPQVAKKTDWDLEKFLGHCSRDKAGLGWEGWKTAELFTYEAAIFKG